MASVEGAIVRALPELSGADVMSLMERLRDLGVEEQGDLCDIEEGDVVPPLKKLKARKLVNAIRGQASGSAGVGFGGEATRHPQQRHEDDDFEVLSRTGGNDYEPMPTNDKPCYRLLLLGKTGEGKSATGNSILGRKEFNSKSDTKSVTKTVSQAYCERGDCVIKIIDGPGTGETRLYKQKAVEKATRDLTRAMEKCTEGFHAMVMIYKFGNRFTQEDQDSIDFLKRMLGDHVFKMFGICVITCGDQFRGTMEDDGTPDMTIAEWCKKQDQSSSANERITFSSLLNECGNRVVLFNNRTRDEREQFEQIEELLKTIKRLPSEGNLYTSDQFDAMHKMRQILIIESKLPQMEEVIQQKCSLIQGSLEKINLRQPNASVKMNELKMAGQELISEIIAKDADTGVLLPLKANVDMVLRTIYNFEETQRKLKEKEQENLNAEELRRVNAENDERIRQLQSEIDENRFDFNKTVRKLQKDADDVGFLEKMVNKVVSLFKGWFS